MATTYHPITGFPNVREKDNRKNSDIVLGKISRTNIKKFVGNNSNLSIEIYHTLSIKF